MKKLFWFTLILTLLLALFIIPQTANAATDGIYTYSVYNGKAEITDCSTSASGSITIPSTLGGYPVTYIGSDAFEYCNKLTSITIPEGVTSIGSWAFENCTGITSITIPDSVTNIGSDAFYYCNNLTSITIGKGVTSIGNYAFSNCTRLEKIYWNAVSVSAFSSRNDVFENAGRSGNGIEVVFGDSVQKIPAYLFNATSVTEIPKVISITIGNNVTSIGDYAFSDCTELTSITIGGGVTGIGYKVFYDSGYYNDNSNWENDVLYIGNHLIEAKITLPGDYTIKDGTTSIGESAFYGCTGLTSITIPDSVTSIGRSAFSGCTGLTSITIPDSVTSIGSSAFYGCTGLEKITIPDSVTSIGGAAFRGCTGITSITIPDGVISIGDGAFYNCTGLEKINWNAVSVSDFTSSSDVFYKAGTSGIGIEVVFGDSVQKIPAYLFYDSNSSYSPKVTSVTIGNNVTSIGNCAFRECSRLEKIYWNAVSVSDFTSSSDVFANAGQNGDGIEVIFGDNVQKIPAYLFYDSNSSYSPKVTSVTIGNNVTSIGVCAFRECTRLEKINWNAVSVSDFTTSSQVFYNAGIFGNGIEVVFGDSVQKIPAYLFTNSSYVTSVIIGNNVTSIGESAFDGCTGLTSVTIGESVTSIGNCAFMDCTELTSITIGDSVTSIGNYAFSGCTGLTSITIPDSVTNIGYRAFYGCTGLTSITIPDSVTTIEGFSFYDCWGLEKIYWNAVSVPDFTSSSKVFANAGQNGDGIEVIFGDNVQKIPAYLFYQTYYADEANVKSVTIGTNVTSIGNCAFRDCTELTSITISDSVTSIGDYAFYNVNEIVSIIYNGTKNQFNFIIMKDGNTALKDDNITYLKCYYKFVDHNGNIVKEQTVDNGSIIYAPDVIITKPATAQYTYTHTGWNGFEEGMTLTEDITFEPVFSSVINKYTYKFVDEDGTVLKETTVDYGTKIVPPSNPTKASTEKYTYKFSNWSGYTSGMTITDDVSFTANYTAIINKYPYKFVNYDGTIIKQGTAEYGSLITSPSNPSRSATAQYTYIFAGWDGYNEGTTQLAKEMVFTAKFNSITRKYTYKFVNDNGETIKEQTSEYGMVIYAPDVIITKPATQKYTYTHTGWNGFTEDMTLTGNVTFTPKFSSVVNKYTYKFIDEDGTILKEETVDYGTTIYAPAITDKTEYYLFDKWQGYTSGMTVTGDVSFKAVYKLAKYSIKISGIANSVTVTYNSNYTLPVQQKSEYIFKGYYTGENGTGENLTNENGESIVPYNVTESITAYPYFESIYLNKICVEGNTNVYPGDTLTQQIVFATSQDAMYVTATVKYPQSFVLNKIENVDFADISKDSETTKDGYTYLNITCLYDFNGEYIPVNTKTTLMQLVFDVSTDAKIGSSTIEISDVLLIGEDDYKMDNTVLNTVSVIPKLAESIQITGASQIDAQTVYTAVVMPEYASNKEVEWSVDDTSIATIDQNGVLTPLKSGTVTITATAKDGSGVYATKDVTIIFYAVIDSIDFGNGVCVETFDKDKREYTVYVNANTQKISITPTFTNGVTRPNGSGIWISGRAKEFDLNETVNTITINRESVDGYENSVYTITVEKLNGVKIVSDNTIITCTQNATVNQQIIIATYNGNQMTECSINNYNEKPVYFKTSQPCTFAKVFLWENMISAQPIADAVKVDIAR